MSTDSLPVSNNHELQDSHGSKLREEHADIFGGSVLRETTVRDVSEKV
jgi:hypothetical protein